MKRMNGGQKTLLPCDLDSQIHIPKDRIIRSMDGRVPNFLQHVLHVLTEFLEIGNCQRIAESTLQDGVIAPHDCAVKSVKCDDVAPHGVDGFLRRGRRANKGAGQTRTCWKMEHPSTSQ